MKFLSPLFFAILLVSYSRADTFGNGSNTFEIEFVNIGSPGNAADFTGYPYPAGAVAYEYRIGKYEVSERMISVANQLGGLSINKSFRGPNKPVTNISWFSAARFVNWLNVSSGYFPAYKFALQPGSSGYYPQEGFQVWTPTDPGYNPNNLFRNSLAKYFLPSMDEWYKAAFYDPSNGVYYDYPTGSNSIPDGVDFVGDPNFDVVFDNGALLFAPYDITNVGKLSPMGTAGQAGNVEEWDETPFSGSRGYRGGFWAGAYQSMSSTSRLQPYEGEEFFIGFRVASLAEASIVGDFEGDDDVDGRDFLMWQRNPSIGDLADWQQNFGFSSITASSTAVPEPSTVVLIFITGMAASLSRRSN